MKNVVKKQHGFTLLELVVVVAVMGLIASLATEFVVQDSNQERYEKTAAKVKTIREALIGQPNLSSNGEVQVSGFIADTGVLPSSLLELMLGEYCTNPEFLRNETACSNAGATWKNIEGWKGPYLVDYNLATGTFDRGTTTTSDDIDVEYPVYRDAWGNNSQAWAEVTDSSDTKLEDDIFNSGWRFNDDSGNLIVVSAGLDGMRNPANYTTMEANTSQQSAYVGSNTFEKDYPRAVYVGSSEPYSFVEHIFVYSYMYKAAVQPTVELSVFNDGADSDLCARVKRIGNGSSQFVSETPVTVSAGSSAVLTVSFEDVLHGSYIADVFKTVSGCSTETDITD